MALRRVELIAENPGASWNGLLLNGDALTTGNGSVEYRCYCDSADDGPYEIVLSPLLPKLGSFYRGSLVRYVSYSFSNDGRSGTAYCWRVRYSLGGVPLQNASGGETTDDSEPTDALSLTASPEAENYAVPFDLDGVANVNSVGEWFSDPLNVEYGRLRLTFGRVEYSNPFEKSLRYWNAINSTPLWKFAANTVRVESIVPTLDASSGNTRWNVSYTLVYRAIGWLERRADAGFYAIGANGLARILNGDGSPRETPTLLNGAGGVLPTGSAPVYRTFRLNPLLNLNELGLPNPFEL